MSKQAGVVVVRAINKTIVAGSVRLQCFECGGAGDCDPVVVVDTTIDNIQLNAKDPVPIPFEIEVPSQGAYTLFVHIDVAGNGTIDIGDYVTTYSVLLPDDRSTLTVFVDQVV